jgi:hypothetical protein
MRSMLMSKNMGQKASQKLSSTLKFRRPVKQRQLAAFHIDLSKSRQPGHCVVCHNLNPLGHEETVVEKDGAYLILIFYVSELRSECVYCAVIQKIRAQFAPQPPNPPSLEDLAMLHLKDSKPADLGFRRKIPGERKWESEMATVAAISLYVDQHVSNYST